VLDVVHPEDGARLMAELAGLTRRQSQRVDARVRASDGSWRWFEVNVTNLVDDPDIAGIVVAGHDITDRKNLEHELLRSEAYIKSLVQHASDTILVLDAMVRIRYASPSARGLFGLSASRLLGANVLDLVHPEDRDLVADGFLDAAHEGGSTAYLDFRVQGVDGKERHVEAAATNLLDHPATNGIVVNLRDLADRDRAREASERSERRFRKLIANISDTITLVDGEGRIMLTTGAAREILGHPQAYWPGKSIFDLVHPDDAGTARSFQDAVLRNDAGDDASVQFRVVHADGAWVDVEINAANLLDDPDVRGVVITSRNITAHKAIERALSAAHKQALDALAAKAEFVAQVSHEVRTPIHGILGMAELLSEAELDPERRRLVDAIRRSGETLGLVINDLLDFSKMEAGRLELSEGSVSPHRLVADVVDMLAPSAEERGLVLHGTLDAQVPPFVMGDELRLRQVLVNLLGNAVKYTEEGTVVLRVETARRMGEAYLLRFAITDTGVGIPADELDHLFEPFVQASTTAALRRPGTGLGLSICRQLVELMGGEVTVQSEVGIGSTFSFTLPTVEAGPDQLAAPRPVSAPTGVRGRVLVVEDSPVNQVLVERQLARLGCEPVVAATGRDALVLMDQLDFDLVLMDCQLPGLDGLETSRLWRAQERPGRRLPIVALTAAAEPGAEQRCVDAGMDGFLSKPVNLDGLAEVLGRFVARADTVAGVSPTGAESGGVDASVDELGVDPRVLENLVRELGDRSIAARVLTTYLDELDGRLASLRTSVVSGDRHTLQRTAHTLRSTSRALGADGLAEACGLLEISASNDAVDPTPLVDDVVRIAASVAGAMRSHLRALVP
jgi:PAS domain S-box-containing protein